MIVLKYFIWFILFGFMGWVYESLAMTIWTGKWENRGFLFGPLIPIYGFGAIALTIVLSIYHLSNLQVFILSVLGSVILEMSTSILLEKLFHAYWWDYSEVPLNFQGRICLPASLGFGIAGLIVRDICLPIAIKVTSHMSSITLQVIALLLAGLLAADTATTVSDLVNFDSKVKYVMTRFDSKISLAVENIKMVAGRKQRSTLRRIKGFKIKDKKRYNFITALMNKIRSMRQEGDTNEVKRC